MGKVAGFFAAHSTNTMSLILLFQISFWRCLNDSNPGEKRVGVTSRICLYCQSNFY